MNESKIAREKRNFNKRIKDARIGDPAAQYEVGLMYANGVGVERDVDQAFAWTKSAAERGHSAAQYLLGSAYAGGLVGAQRDDQKAVLWFLKAAEQGSEKAFFKLAKVFEVGQESLAMNCCFKAAEQGLADAQMAMGDRYAQGSGVTRDPAQAYQWYKRAADQGLAVAQFALGQIHEQGLGFPVDLTEACHLYRAASAQGLPGAQLALERLDADGLGRVAKGKHVAKRLPTRDRRSADSRWVTFAERGNSDDRYHLGLMYEVGMGVERNTKLARFWLQKAAEQGHVKAQLTLGRLSEKLDCVVAVTWYEKAAEQGDVEAQYSLGRLCAAGQGVVKDSLTSLTWYLRAADQKYADAWVAIGQAMSAETSDIVTACFTKAANNGAAVAQCALGGKYLHGIGVARDFYLASHWYQLAAEQGSAEAQCALGGLYAEGRGVQKDLIQAFRWYEMAAIQGFAKAQWTLGELYASGIEGVGKDNKQATLWCKKAASAGFGPAQATLGNLFAKAKKFERAVEWWSKAAEQGDPEALFNLASAVHSGTGVQQDLGKAFLLWLKAAQSGLPAAQTRVGLAYVKGDGVAFDQIEGCRWFVAAASGGDAAALANSARAKSLMSPAQYAEACRRAEASVNQTKNSTGNPALS